MLVFDLTNETSFINVRNWITEIQSNAYSENVDMILVGNKCDLENQRIISKTRAMEFAKQYNVDYIETSALKNINVAESVKSLLDSVMNRLQQNQSLSRPNQDPKKTSNEQTINRDLESSLKTGPKVSYCCSY